MLKADADAMFEGLRFIHWKAEQDADGLVTLTLDRADSRVNALSRAVLEELEQIVERLAIEQPAGVVIASAKPSGFAVGADIHEFVAYAREGSVLENIERGQRIFEALARLPCPTVAALHGLCLGGGTELALACGQRIAADDEATRIGLPEVKLGIHPGWGGTARLPRLIGAPDALALMLTGKALSARAALATGLVHRLAPRGDLLAEARALLRHPQPLPAGRRARALLTNAWPARQILAPLVRRRTAAKVRPEHYPAPFALIEVWRRGGGDIEQRLALEARSVTRLAATPTARNLIRLFFLQERLKHQGEGTVHGIARLHVVGAGVMGADIAAWAALKGFQVTLQDREAALVSPALARAHALFASKLGSERRIEEAMGRLQADVEGHGIATADLVIEAIVEDAEAKRALYAQIEPRLKPEAILASNTSGLPLELLARDLAAPQRFLGLHFFNPVARMPLVEVGRQPRLDGPVEKRALAFAAALGKLPLAVAGTPGLLVNRVLMPYLLEALRLYGEGVPGPLLDRAARDFGMPMGPIELADTVGLDVCAAVGRELASFLGLELPAGVLEPRLAAGKRGRKDGEGLYVWQDGRPQKPKPADDTPMPEDLADRLLLPLVNEAVACLADGVVDDADLLDAGVVFGTGFAPFRGGPIQYLREEGVEVVRARLERLARRHGERFKPRRGWDLAALWEAPDAASAS